MWLKTSECAAVWIFPWSEWVSLFSVWRYFCTIIIKVSKYETSQGLFHSLSGCYLHLFSLWEPMTHSCHLQTGNINSMSGPIYPRWLWPKVAALQVLRQVILFGWSCASWWSQRKASPSVCVIASQVVPPTSLRAIYSRVQRTTSPALESASQSGAVFFIRWRLCSELATADSVSLGNTFFCWSSPTELSQDA